MGNAVSTAGILVGYGIETIAGTEPAAFINIPDVVDIPEIGGAPGSLETTVLAETINKTYTPDLVDPGGALGLTVNLTKAFITAWETLITAQAAGATTDFALWVQIKYPQLDKDITFTAIATALSGPASAISSVLQTQAYITPTGQIAWGDLA